MGKTKKINVKGTEISIVDENNVDYVSLTDMIKNNPIKKLDNWLRIKNTIEFLGVWELLNNPNFNSITYEEIKNNAIASEKTLSVKEWVKKTNAIGIISKAGRYGGTYAHKDIAYHFGMWLSPEFQLLIIQEFDRLKTEEAERLKIGWDFRRQLTKVNYKLHTKSIQDNIISKMDIPKFSEKGIYAYEADILNLAIFKSTSGEWKRKYKNEIKKSENPRDYANTHELTVLSNLESLNAKLIRDGLSHEDRLIILEKEASYQLRDLYATSPYTNEQIQSPNKRLT